MLEKVEFSDIYKFLASIGLIMIVAAILLPIFIFQFDVVKNYRGIDFKITSDTVKQSIQCQEGLVYLLIRFWWLLSSLLLIIGLLVFGCGINKWKKRQAVLDKSQDLDVQAKEKIIKEASQDQIDKKLNEDVDEIEDDKNKKPLVLQTYKVVEDRVFNSIITNDSAIRIKRNARVNNFIYDLIIMKRLSYQDILHKVCEIKYYQKEIFYSYVKHGISSFLLAAANYEKYVSSGDNRINVQYYMMWICTNQDQKNRLESYSHLAQEYSIDKGIPLSIILKLESELDSIKDELL